MTYYIDFIFCTGIKQARHFRGVTRLPLWPQSLQFTPAASSRIHHYVPILQLIIRKKANTLVTFVFSEKIILPHKISIQPVF